MILWFYLCEVFVGFFDLAGKYLRRDNLLSFIVY